MMLDVAGQFGGIDAGDCAVPHFGALKLACRSTQLSALPGQLTFILRVDGDVRQFGARGLDNLVVGDGGGGVSVDICLDELPPGHQDPSAADGVIATSFRSAASWLREQGHPSLASWYWDALEQALNELCDRYLAALPEQHPEPDPHMDAARRLLAGRGKAPK